MKDYFILYYFILSRILEAISWGFSHNWCKRRIFCAQK